MGTAGAQHRLRKVGPERCQHFMRLGECVLASCPHYDGQGSPFESERADRRARVENPRGVPRLNGRTKAVLARIGDEWALFQHSPDETVRNRDAVILGRLVRTGLVERREAPGQEHRREYRRKP